MQQRHHSTLTCFSRSSTTCWEQFLRRVNVPAGEAWKVCRGLQLSEIIVQKLPHVLHKIELVEGDGGVGTILKLTLPPGAPGLRSYKEKFTVTDDEKRVKEVEVIEGGYLDLGFTLFRIRLEIVENGENSCITKTKIEYDVKEEAAANTSTVTVQPLVAVMKPAADYLNEENNK